MAASKPIAARLHPGNEQEKRALDIYEGLIVRGYSAREIITDALLRMAGITPEMFRDRRERIPDITVALQDIKQELAAIREDHAEQMRDLLRKVKAADPDAFRAFADETDDETDDLDLDPDFIRNAQKAMRKTYRQEHRE